MNEDKSRVDIKIGDREEYRTSSTWPYHVSCGGVVYRKNVDKIEVLLLGRGADFNAALGRKSVESWHLPKGTLKYTETLVEGAIREVREEAGVEIEVEVYIGSRIADWVEAEIHYIKDHHYFLMKYLGEHVEPMDHEHEKKAWFPLDEADKIVEWDQEIILRAKKALEKIV